MAFDPPLLLLDTCLLLDVIRAPARENIGLHDLQAVQTLVARQAARPAELAFAITQQVRDEYAEHVNGVETETERALVKLVGRTNDMLRIAGVFHTGTALLGHLHIDTPGIAASLRAVADGILGCARIIPHIAADSHLAGQRVLLTTPPATRAKQSFKDCQIVEGVLRHVMTLRAAGTVSPAVFASSNTADYHQGHSSLHPDLRAEFDACGLGFAPSWAAARYELDRR